MINSMEITQTLGGSARGSLSPVPTIQMNNNNNNTSKAPQNDNSSPSFSYISKKNPHHFMSPLKRRSVICSVLGTLCLTRGVFDHLLELAPMAALALDITEISIVTSLLTWDIMYHKVSTHTFIKIGSWVWTIFFVSVLGITSPVSRFDTRILQITLGSVAIATYAQLLIQAHGIAMSPSNLPTSANAATDTTIKQWEKRRKLRFMQYVVYVLVSAVYVVTWALGPDLARLITRKWYIELCRTTLHVPLLTIATWLSVCTTTACSNC